LSQLKVLLPDDVGAALMDGVVLCHLANHICPRSVASIHVPSPAVPKLSMAKCRRNVENFLDACKKLGVPQVNTIKFVIHALHVVKTNPVFHKIKPSKPPSTEAGMSVYPHVAGVIPIKHIIGS
uniref:Calponin-homology (CH) domain-containing protein n=1 Tax=Acanthochromis polyacanthus TaxID=80966 RepID=A0A3Q1GAC1_9TELE